MSPIVFAGSAFKHSISEGDQRYAISNPVVVKLVEPDVVLIIGHPHDQTERCLEILVRALPNGDKKVFHAMQLGPKFRPYLGGNQ